MKTLRQHARAFVFSLAASVAVLYPFVATIPVVAQTTLNSTTLSAAITQRDQQVISLTSVTNISLGDTLTVNAEAMQVNALDTTALTATVARGVAGTAARTHPSGSVVYSGTRGRFYSNEVIGSCTAVNEQFLPHIVLPTLNIYDCKNSEWVRLRHEGYRVWYPGRTDGATTYTAAGAITIQPGVSFINGATLAMTLANPTFEQNGMIMVILSTNASAQTVTYTAGFGGGTTARDVATFGGAINDGFVIVAFNQVWWVVSTRNVTLG